MVERKKFKLTKFPINNLGIFIILTTITLLVVIIINPQSPQTSVGQQIISGAQTDDEDPCKEHDFLYPKTVFNLGGGCSITLELLNIEHDEIYCSKEQKIKQRMECVLLTTQTKTQDDALAICQAENGRCIKAMKEYCDDFWRSSIIEVNAKKGLEKHAECACKKETDKGQNCHYANNNKYKRTSVAGELSDGTGPAQCGTYKTTSSSWFNPKLTYTYIKQFDCLFQEIYTPGGGTTTGTDGAGVGGTGTTKGEKESTETTRGSQF